MSWYPWLNAPYRQIIGQHQQGRAHHALLLHALPGMGEERLSWGIGRWLLCQRRDGLKSCGECHGCQLMQAGNHPDWHNVVAEKGKSSIGVDAVRTLSETLWQHAQQGGARVACIPDAAQLTDAAANALLKTLEEPPANCWFLLGCREPGQLLPTLRSRCLLWHLAPPPEASSLQWIMKQGITEEAEAMTALRLCSGAPAAALALLEPAVWQQRQAVCAALTTLAGGGDVLALLDSFNKEDAPQRISWLTSILLDALKYAQAGGAQVQNVDQQRLAQQFAATLPVSVLLASVHLWLRCRDALLNVVAVNRELLLTEYLLTWERELARAPV
ncbi:DNA polymerase III subunit delta' [Enterobacterales bacterium CwR94]|nr:DNA polymerase III subunit delta' [Enterobacterales bacterium CwR94]